MLRRNGWHGISLFRYAWDVFAMKLWLLTNDTVGGYDTYDSAVVSAPDELTAQMTHPSYGNAWDGSLEKYPCWCRSKDVIVKYIGEAAPLTEAGVVCASFNAG